jgi:hypothetical protein
MRQVEEAGEVHDARRIAVRKTNELIVDKDLVHSLITRKNRKTNTPLAGVL